MAKINRILINGIWELSNAIMKYISQIMIIILIIPKKIYGLIQDYNDIQKANIINGAKVSFDINNSKSGLVAVNVKVLKLNTINSTKFKF